MAFKLTGEQENILDAFVTGSDVVITALAGTGKTTILKEIAKAHPRRRMTYVAFNKAIADEAQRTFPRNVTARTMHAFAFAGVGRNYVDRLNGPRVEAWKVANILGIPERFEFGEFSLRSNQLARLTTEAVSRFCHSSSEVPARSNIPKVPGLTSDAARRALEDLLLPFVVRAWEDLTSANGRLRYTHDCYLKMWSQTNPQLPGDVVLADEFQDSDAVIKQIVDNQNDSQRIPVGDSNQQIYSFRGTVDALSLYPDAIHLPLQQSFRFGPRIAAEANRILEVLGTELRVVGFDEVDSQLAFLDDPDCVLTRTNAGAIARLMSAQIAGVRAGLVGGTAQVEALAKAALDLTEGRKTTHHELVAFDSWGQVRTYVEEDSDAVDLKVLVKLVDRHGPHALLEAVQRAVPESVADLVISTAHKAKGREWDRVHIASDFSDPRDEETREWNKEELRLAYVSATRGKKLLDCSNFGWLTELAIGDTDRHFLVPEEVPARVVPVLEVADVLSTEQLIPDPEDATRLMFQNTRYDPALVSAQQRLARNKFFGEYCGQSKVRVVLATAQAIMVAEQFGLSISQAARDRVAELAG